MNVAAIQFKATREQPDASLKRLVGLAHGAAQGGVDLLVLPEMAATGYVFPSVEAVDVVAEPPDGRTFRALSLVAREHACWLVVGFPERDGERYFNSALVLNPKGERAFVYRKTLLFEADTTWATPGDSGYRAFDTDGGRFAPGICMDLNDDGFMDWCRNARLDAVALPTNWLEEGEPVWPYWAWRMAGQNAALVAANRWGQDAHITFCGQSAVLHHQVLLAAAPREGDGVIIATIPRSPGVLPTR